ncbi:hypothetical protein Tco_0218201 [Tanacetum coccineum]
MGTIDSMKYVLTQSALDTLCEKYHIPDVVHPEIPGRNDRICNSPTEMDLFAFINHADPTKVVDVGGIDVVANDEVQAIVADKPQRVRNKRKAADGASGSVCWKVVPCLLRLALRPQLLWDLLFLKQMGFSI